MSTIKVENCGPIKALEVELGEPGVYVVVGPNGSGKTTLLDTLDVVTGRGDRKPTKREGTAVGKVEALGVTLRLGAKVTKAGKLAIESVEGQSAIGILIDPGIKDPTAADARRIEALVSMCGAKADLDLFTPLDPIVAEILHAGEFGAECSLVAMAAEVRKRLHAKALEAEKDAQQTEANATGARAAAEGVDTSLAETHPNDLAMEARNAERSVMQLEAEAKTAADSQRAADEARKKLADATNDELPTVGEATESAEEAARVFSGLQSTVESLNRQLESATIRMAAAKESHQRCVKAIREAESRAAIIATCEAQIAAGSKPGPSGADIASARQIAAEANERIQKAAVARKAKEQLKAAEDFDAAAKRQKERSEQLRKAAWGVDGVLASQIERLGTPVEIQDGRMVAHVDGREVFVHDLSYGQRAQLFGTPYCNALGAGGLGTIDQRTWEGLDGIGREAFAELVRSRGVYVLTAEAERSAEPERQTIRVEKYQTAEGN